MENEQTDPSERNRPHLEPTEAAHRGNINFYEIYTNPYERPGPYAQSLPTIPPPPPGPKSKRNRFGILLLCLIGFALTGSAVYIGISGIPWQTPRAMTPSLPPTATRISPPSPALTATALPTPAARPPIITGAKAPYPASQIIAAFSQAGLAPQTTSIDISWSCCQYYPEGGANYWKDLQTGTIMDLATFASIDEAQIDSKNLADRGFGAYVENYCLLSYEGTPSDVQSYFSIMAQVCTYE